MCYLIIYNRARNRLLYIARVILFTKKKTNAWSVSLYVPPVDDLHASRPVWLLRPTALLSMCRVRAHVYCQGKVRHATGWPTCLPCSNPLAYLFTMLQSSGLPVYHAPILWLTCLPCSNPLAYLFTMLQSSGLPVYHAPILWLTCLPCSNPSQEILSMSLFHTGMTTIEMMMATTTTTII